MGKKDKQLTSITQKPSIFNKGTQFSSETEIELLQQKQQTQIRNIYINKDYGSKFQFYRLLCWIPLWVNYCDSFNTIKQWPLMCYHFIWSTREILKKKSPKPQIQSSSNVRRHLHWKPNNWLYNSHHQRLAAEGILTVAKTYSSNQTTDITFVLSFYVHLVYL